MFLIYVQVYVPFSPTFLLGRNVTCFGGGGASWDGWWLREPGPSGALQVDWISFHGLPSPLPLPLGGAGRAKQRKELTRKEEAGGLRILGAPLPLPLVSGARKEGKVQKRGLAGPRDPQRGVRFKRK